MKLFVVTVFILTTVCAKANLARDTTIKGVEISFDYSSDIFPGFWQQPPINAAAEPIDYSEIGRCKEVVQSALEKYPPGLLKKELKSVYFIRSMKFYDVGYGGTNSTDALYLANNGDAQGYTNLYLEQTFHHEFSSILYRNHPSLFRENEWNRANSPGFSYTDPENGVGAIRDNRSSQDFDTVLCAKGFLTQYATSGIENDLNTVAQNLFSPSPGFWDIVKRFPRIQRKVRLLTTFYNHLDPIFTISYFKKFSHEE
jgi:hypothetical protein